ncbi:MAG: CBS domain-containing protein [Anaerolineales bacterium]|nr:CBS domain-containing protein [Anaerolineales bacterium]
MSTIRLLLEKKGHNVWSVAPDATVYDALRLLDERDIGALLVIRGEELVGILSERDYARKVALKGKTSMKTPVHEIMTDQVIVIGPERTIEQAMAIMTERRLRHLPVVENDQVIGVVSIGDLVKEIIADREFIIEQLESYIAGQRSGM